MNIMKLFAATIQGCTGKDCEVPIPETTGNQLLANGLNLAYFAIGIVAVVFIIMAGYRYLTANGDPAKAHKAMQTILYAIIGLVVVVSAFAITNFVMGRI